MDRFGEAAHWGHGRWELTLSNGSEGAVLAPTTLETRQGVVGRRAPVAAVRAPLCFGKEKEPPDRRISKTRTKANATSTGPRIRSKTEDREEPVTYVERAGLHMLNRYTHVERAQLHRLNAHNAFNPAPKIAKMFILGIINEYIMIRFCRNVSSKRPQT